jgi:caspase domain-containing protein
MMTTTGSSKGGRPRAFVLLAALMLAWVAALGVRAEAAEVRVDRPAEKRLALVIGNARYPELALNNPENDAHLIAATLRSLGFEVTELVNVKAFEFRRAVREFARRLQGEEGAGVFYYAGHGVQIDGRNYLLPVDINLRDEDEVRDDGIDVDELLLRRLDHANGRVRIVILDACRDNPYAGAGSGRLRPTANSDAPSSASGALIAYSSGPGQPAEDGPAGSNSVYTRNLVKEMVATDLEVEQMFKRVRVDVVRETANRQVPWVNSSMTANFSFHPAGAVAGNAEPQHLAQIVDAPRAPAAPAPRPVAVVAAPIVVPPGVRVAPGQSERCVALLVRVQLGEPVSAGEVAYLQAACANPGMQVASRSLVQAPDEARR